MEQTILTRAGEQWDEIARRVYRSEFYADWLMKNNLRALDTFQFAAGVRIFTPPLPAALSENLPPWRRGT
jgi:hypothetical protein